MNVLICGLISFLLSVVAFFIVGIIYLKQIEKVGKEKVNIAILIIHSIAILVMINASAIKFATGNETQGILWMIVIHLQMIITYITTKN